ncbi:prepilin-type N-terminal cleavage/methylation domain-containing protein [bacterium]|nr:prepilin-type N-terminal cleavage/methylation domain-containing protein [bacterium]
MIFWRKGFKGYTLIEVLIAISLFAMFFTFLIKTFSSGSDSFNTGSWRLTKQKEAQIFLGRLKDLLEKANYAERVGPDGDIGTTFQAMPIYVRRVDPSRGFFQQEESCSSIDTPVMYFSISEPYIAAQPELNIPEKKGTWTGVTIHCKNNMLTLKRTSNWNDIGAPFNAYTDTHPDVTWFLDGKAQVNVNTDIDNVTALGIYLNVATDAADIGTGTTIIVEMELSQFKGNKPTNAKMRESLKAKLIRTNHEVKPF